MKLLVLKSKMNSYVSAWYDSTINEGSGRLKLKNGTIVFLVEFQETGPDSVEGFAKIYAPDFERFLSVYREEIEIDELKCED